MPHNNNICPRRIEVEKIVYLTWKGRNGVSKSRALCALTETMQPTENPNQCEEYSMTGFLFLPAGNEKARHR